MVVAMDVVVTTEVGVMELLETMLVMESIDVMEDMKMQAVDVILVIADVQRRWSAAPGHGRRLCEFVRSLIKCRGSCDGLTTCSTQMSSLPLLSDVIAGAMSIEPLPITSGLRRIAPSPYS